MKLGADNKRELMVMVVLLAVAIPLALYSFRDQLFGSASAANVPLASLPSASATKAGPAGTPRNDDPRFRLDILEHSRKVKYEAGRDIFRMEAPKIEPVKTVRDKGAWGPPAPPTPTPTPPPPPIPITYYGYANRPGEPKRIFLQKNGDDEVFVAAQGDIVARRYKVVQIQPTSVTMEDVLTKNQEAIRLTPK
jgi:hypothetical protein